VTLRLEVRTWKHRIGLLSGSLRSKKRVISGTVLGVGLGYWFVRVPRGPFITEGLRFSDHYPLNSFESWPKSLRENIVEHSKVSRVERLDLSADGAEEHYKHYKEDHELYAWSEPRRMSKLLEVLVDCQERECNTCSQWYGLFHGRIRVSGDSVS
jgi:hypothetical protein